MDICPFCGHKLKPNKKDNKKGKTNKINSRQCTACHKWIGDFIYDFWLWVAIRNILKAHGSGLKCRQIRSRLERESIEVTSGKVKGVLRVCRDKLEVDNSTTFLRYSLKGGFN